MKRNNKQFDFRTAMIDLLLNVLTSMIFIFLITTMIMQIAKKSEEGAPRKAEYIASITWDDKIDCDVDLWARDPDNVVVAFSNKNQEMMNLERDDLGFYNDAFSAGVSALNSMMGNTEPKVGDQYNEETLVFRGIKKGKYILNVHLYSCRTTINGQTKPVKPNELFKLKVSLKIMKINPYKIAYTTEVEFSKVWEEMNLVEFTVNDKKEIVNYEDTDVKLVRERTFP